MNSPVIGGGVKAGEQVQIIALPDEPADVKDIHIAEGVGVVQNGLLVGRDEGAVDLLGEKSRLVVDAQVDAVYTALLEQQAVELNNALTHRLAGHTQRLRVLLNEPLDHGLGAAQAGPAAFRQGAAEHQGGRKAGGVHRSSGFRIDLADPLGQLQSALDKLGVHGQGLDLPKIGGRLYKRRFHRHKHQGVVHDLRHIGVKDLTGGAVALNVLLKHRVVLHTQAEVVPILQEVVEECDRHAVHRLVRQDVEESLTLCHVKTSFLFIFLLTFLSYSRYHKIGFLDNI